MTAPFVSIVIRAWRPDWLDDAIRSVRAQSHRDLELVVYDDRGDLQPWVLRAGDARVRYHRAAQRLGPSGRFREAVALARGDVIGVLDDDDRYQPEFVARLLPVLLADHTRAVAFCRTTWQAGDRLYRPRDRRPAGVQRDLARAMLVDGWTISPSHCLIRRSALDDVTRQHPLPDDVAPDAFLNLHAASSGWSHVLVDDWLVVCRWHAAQFSRSFPAGRDAAIATFRAVALEDPVLAALVARRLARAYVARAFGRIERGDPAGASADLRLAQATSPSSCRVERLALQAAAVARPAGRLAAIAAQAWSSRGRGRPPARIGAG